VEWLLTICVSCGGHLQRSALDRNMDTAEWRRHMNEQVIDLCGTLMSRLDLISLSRSPFLLTTLPCMRTFHPIGFDGDFRWCGSALTMVWSNVRSGNVTL
jgi:hypothetical protein